MEYTPLYKPPTTQRLKSGRVILQPGEEVGEHKTDSKEEIIIVLKGQGILIGKQETQIAQGSAYFVPKETVHNVKNTTQDLLEYIYVVALL